MDLDQPRVPNVYGPGTFTDRECLPVPDEAARLLRLLINQTPNFNSDPSKVQFTGEPYPLIPGPLKSVPLAAALHGISALLADEILSLRQQSSPSNRTITISTTQTTLWLSTASSAYLDSKPLINLFFNRTLGKYLPDWQQSTLINPIDLRGTGIYPTSSPGKWYLLHGSLNPPPMLRNLGIDPTHRPEIDTPQKAYNYIRQHTTKYSAEELEYKNLVSGFCGSICFTPKEWSETTMAKALSSRPLIDVTSQPDYAIPIPPTPFPSDGSKPLSGIKVLELGRIIAAPQIGCILASYGAEVIRVNAPHLPDMNMLQVSFNAGKTTIALDLRLKDDRVKMYELLKGADVFIQGFRPGRLKQFGLGEDDILNVGAKRGKGIVYVAENCFGSEGVYASRPGWQQVADCTSGAAYVMGRAYGLPDGECVLPSLPVSDMMCGLVGAVGVMMGLRDRAVKGGSYIVRPALVKGNMVMLSQEVGLYSPEVVKECQERFKWKEMRGEHHVLDLLRIVWGGWEGNEVMKEYLREDNEEVWKIWEKSEFGGGKARLGVLKPVVRFEKEGKLEDGVSPEWTSASVPYGFHDKETVRFREESGGFSVQGLWNQFWGAYHVFRKQH
ncbi:succinate--hydroxymethylglutarate CoA-transferase [Podospora fimiseda]|uniref:Succinate--hydroxymethylglutarate CoA-transferase n=1 Tax=Podospora fimiseda TaxID=252190 RepID=A0AAN7BH35_9PEZI|nr:succinate--hydroxymethylglutarate CoA-transferase [Podospora fimiseda]